MKCVWKILKYSMRKADGVCGMSMCGVNIELFGEVVQHSRFSSQGVRRQQWLHIYEQSNLMLDVTVSESCIEVRLHVISAVRHEIVLLERAGFEMECEIDVCMERNMVSCRHSGRQFKIMLADEKETLSFDQQLEITSHRHSTKYRCKAMLDEFAKMTTYSLGTIQPFTCDYSGGRVQSKLSAFMQHETRRDRLIKQFLILICKETNSIQKDHVFAMEPN
ncbi:hypothetical protein HK407_04g07170 [Ordospora pajunii]|jgi:hypothetical protein|uniref:uncharacterized protein n=1 Tax=Ordospora pajunii TaxID=3039483 RepID=UPI002952911B|nr:uncharacterized protein HK407_04g07170 [Ordospora pajunii]KAH9411610.1 hypothetical protein HK407_04g07170 [Ordospora pajunii]